MVQSGDLFVPAWAANLLTFSVREDGSAAIGIMEGTKSVLLYIPLCPRAKSQCFLGSCQVVLQDRMGEVVDRHAIRKYSTDLLSTSRFSIRC